MPTDEEYLEVRSASYSRTMKMKHITDDVGLVPPECEAVAKSLHAVGDESAHVVGDRVRVANIECFGTVRFVGEAKSSAVSGPLLGIELDEPLGEHNGTVDGHRYFKCKKACGILVAPTAVTALEESDDTQAVPPRVPFKQLFAYATPVEKGLVWIATVLAVGQGASWPLWSLLFGEAISKFSDPQTLSDTMSDLAILMSSIGVGIGVITAIHNVIFTDVALKCAARTRTKFLEAVLSQDMDWHSRNSAAALSVRLETAIPKMQMAMAGKLGFAIMNAGQGVVGLVLAFNYSWRLSLVCLGFSPIVGAAMGMFTSYLMTLDERRNKLYERAAVVADEAVALIRTVITFGTYDREIDRFDQKIKQVAADGVVIGRQLGFRMAGPDGSIFFLYTLAFWYGNKLVRDGYGNSGDVIIVLFCILIGFAGLGQIPASMQIISAGQTAAAGIFEVIERESEIDGLSEDGLRPESFIGEISFDAVTFAYPSKPDATVLDSFTARVKPGETLALVGHSGCGKSTIISLLERFYNPSSGRILLDGKPISEYNIQWLRDRVGLVTQQPVLLPATIYENIAMGKEGATKKEVEAAAAAANAHDFIASFPDSYNTHVGSLGSQLSGGQRQRIAIARVLIKDPRILLLDEATSALDNKSEGVVQEALDKAKSGRTTVTVAHRLSTIRNAETIVVVDHGKAVESGSHDELVAADGVYAGMLGAQSHWKTNESGIKVTDTGRGNGDANNNTTDEARKLDDAGGKENLQSDKSTKEADAKLEKAREKRALSWVYARAKQDNWWIFFAMIGAVLGGLIWPANSVVMGEALGVAVGSYGELSGKCAVAAGVTFDAPYADLTTCQYNCTASGRACWGCTAYPDTCVFNCTFGPVASSTGCEIVPGSDQAGCNSGACRSRWVHPGDEELALDWSLGFVGLAVGMGLGLFLRTMFVFVAGEKLTYRVRREIFETFMRQDAGWHDAHDTTTLTTLLAKNAGECRNVYGDWITMMTLIVVMLVFGVAIAAWYCWKLALVTLGMLPIVGYGQALYGKLMADNDEADIAESMKEATESSSTTIAHIQLVTSSGAARHAVAEYKAKVAKCSENNGSVLRIVAISTFFASFTLFATFALAFWYGAQVVLDGDCTFVEMYEALAGILFCGIMAGVYSPMLPNKAAAVKAVSEMIDVLDSCVPMSEIARRNDSKNQSSLSAGRIEFCGVDFTYPTRPGAKILDGLDLVIEAGTTVAVVGESGSGKSTLVSLIQGLYTPSAGKVLVDGVDIKELDGDFLRSQLAVVSQEPRLFNCSIADNIAYSRSKPNTAPATREMITTAGKIANADDFITEFDAKYDYEVGPFGEKLSGGQRQRVAIARAMLDGSAIKVLLLDEATSALDVHSESRVQEALEAARVGRTTLIVAHRLSTVKSADKIVVLQEGRVVESGTFSELVDIDGHFAAFYKTMQ